MQDESHAAETVPTTGPGRLDEEQDGRLRTLTGLAELGRLAPDLSALCSSYRQRDQRATVRPPDPVVVHPVELD